MTVSPRAVGTALKPCDGAGFPHRLDSRLRGNDGAEVSE